MKDRSYQILDSFWLKIIGMISMVFDHFTVIVELTNKLDSLPWMSINVIYAFRIIGRLSFILFSFITVEGVLKSHCPWKYILRLFILGFLCDIIPLLVNKTYIGNPITTLAIGALTIYLLENKKWYIKIISLIPTALIILVALDFIPLKFDYDIYGFLTIIIFYISNKLSILAESFIINQYGLDKETFINSSYSLSLRNAIACILFISYSLLVHFFNPVWNKEFIFVDVMGVQPYAMLSCIFIMLYNGKRGYNKPWFKYGCYLFFPLHILIIFGICYLL